MKVYTLFQYIFDMPVYPSRVLVALYIKPSSTPREIGEQTGIARGKIYQVLQFLEDGGYVDRSTRGIVQLDILKIEERLREGIAELGSIVDNLSILKEQALEEEKAIVLEKLERIEELEDKLRK